ncbi:MULTISPECIES: nuclear transport factor 2 family protein [Aerosakkonema]|uniref:nuclear transport factor 2 family protein n=1 Tax=Aerosakkonema TaxID=1246629 RepID=UPI0035B83C67
MAENRRYKNAVLDDLELQEGLKTLNPKFGDFVTRVAGEAWGLPLISQKTKALITIAVDVANQNLEGPGNPFGAHINMALQQGVTREEIEELLLFLCVYTGFNKVASGFGALNKFFEQRSLQQRTAPMRKNDFAARDEKGKVTFYVLLWKRKGITLELFDNYWKDVHGPVCARLPGQNQYWQLHLANNEGGLWPTVEGIEQICANEDQFNGIAELTFQTDADRQTWFKAAAILMDDEHNLFSKAIGYNTSYGNSKTYVDSIPTGDPNGDQGLLKFHVQVKKSDTASVDAFRQYMQNSFAPAVASSDAVLKFRMHLFEEVDNSRPDAAGVVHSESPEKQYQAAFEIAFSNSLEMEKFFASSEYATATKEMAKYVKGLYPFPQRTAYTFVYDGKMTLAGQRSSRVAELITKIGATNQLKEDVAFLMTGKLSTPNPQIDGKSGLGHYLQGVQHFGITVDDMAKTMEFYIDVLGGKVALLGNGFIGPVLQNNLFQKEQIEAIERNVDPRSLGVPDLVDGSKESLDVRFISFGNTVLEVIHFRDAKLTPNAPNVFQKVPSCVGYANVPHISFHVKDDVNLNDFARILEEECQRRGLTEVVCNRVIHVKSHEERKKVALKYYANKFWNDPEYFIEGYSDSDFGDFYGWSLFYCKGPNGEQLEFNQVTRTAKQNFIRAQQEYNNAHGTNFVWPSSPFKEQAATSKSVGGTMSDLVRNLFIVGEPMNVDGFVTFFADDALYKFSNFPVVYGPKGIKEASATLVSKVKAVHHEIQAMWEVGDTVICEMQVEYIRYDGKVFKLPCCDTIRIKNGKIQEMWVYMDINPVFS